MPLTVWYQISLLLEKTYLTQTDEEQFVIIKTLFSDNQKPSLFVMNHNFLSLKMKSSKAPYKKAI